jgi:hypothetical protein
MQGRRGSPVIEEIARRTPNSKTWALGGRRKRLEIARRPIHYQKDGTFRDISLGHRIDRGHYCVDDAPFTLRIALGEPAYRYENPRGQSVEVMLIQADGQPIRVSDCIAGGELFKWGAVARQADYVLQPTLGGCSALLFLHDETAPKRWTWSVAGDARLLRPAHGRDAKGQTLELVETRKDGRLTVEWTGRATSRQLLRANRGAAWSTDIVWPVVIDPTVNENVSAGADDAGSIWSNNGATFYAFFGVSTALLAGDLGTRRYYAGVRFQTVPIPASATIDLATLTVRAILAITPNINIFGNDVDDAAAWADPGNRIKNITKTTASTNVTSWTANADNAITVTSIVAEILGRAGWASNNDVAFGFFNNAGAGTNIIQFAALEHATLTEARLSIDYTEAGGAAAPNVVGKGLTESRFLHPRALVRN